MQEQIFNTFFSESSPHDGGDDDDEHEEENPIYPEVWNKNIVQTLNASSKEFELPVT